MATVRVRLCLAQIHQLEKISREATKIYFSLRKGTGPQAVCRFPCECEYLRRDSAHVQQAYHER